MVMGALQGWAAGRVGGWGGSTARFRARAKRGLGRGWLMRTLRRPAPIIDMTPASTPPEITHARVTCAALAKPCVRTCTEGAEETQRRCIRRCKRRCRRGEAGPASANLRQHRVELQVGHAARERKERTRPVETPSLLHRREHVTCSCVLVHRHELGKTELNAPLALVDLAIELAHHVRKVKFAREGGRGRQLVLLLLVLLTLRRGPLLGC